MPEHEKICQHVLVPIRNADNGWLSGTSGGTSSPDSNLVGIPRYNQSLRARDQSPELQLEGSLFNDPLLIRAWYP
ncbi:hypothetical protein AXFE_06500 [Acidithrix ferrooxidans]|uniref:Uncharacterized protein n=1 Tax=Acidithrix ferrooxidans TaxID=1280514 RepID=A0A0D8HKS9_9ACTN|nr:hypothetical protein AXFE_06500 [Acidithrix ferrooxidans]